MFLSCPQVYIHLHKSPYFAWEVVNLAIIFTALFNVGTFISVETLLVLQLLPEKEDSFPVICSCPKQSLTEDVTEGILQDSRRVPLEGRCAELCS